MKRKSDTLSEFELKFKEKHQIEVFFKTGTVPGKFIGCTASVLIKQGTLIMAEKPQVTTRGSPPEIIFFESLMSSFEKLTKLDQEDYLKLHDR